LLGQNKLPSTKISTGIASIQCVKKNSAFGGWQKMA
jgi:hypothetical protein